MTSAFNEDAVIEKLSQEGLSILKGARVSSTTTNAFEKAKGGNIELSYTPNSNTDTADIVMTKEVQKRVDYILPWVKSSQPFLIAGPEGCGKETIVRAAFNQIQDQNVKLVRIYCSSQLNADQVISILNENCVKVSVAAGRLLKPKDCSKLVIFFKDLNLPKPDMYNTTEVISLLQ
jgi:transcriptional regulator of acetoin/glycerol metabolism